MKKADFQHVPIAEIRISNPRTRNKITFNNIVASIAAVGLKTPITVSERALTPDGTRYDLVCGQGRVEAFLALGQASIPAVVINATREDQFLMSLVENVARRPPSQVALFKEVKSLMVRGYSSDQIASKLALSESYMRTLFTLIEGGETRLVAMVESGKIPITVATEIANGTPQDVQRALTEAYEKGDLRGPKLKAARRLIKVRTTNEKSRIPNTQSKSPMTAREAMLEYQRHTHSQRALVQRADIVRERLILLATATRQLLADEHFVTLLKAEGLNSLSETLLEKTREL
jgi:ParB family chromosome partitioning protein